MMKSGTENKPNERGTIVYVHEKRDEDGNIIHLYLDIDIDLKRIYQPGGLHEPPQGKGFKHLEYTREDARKLMHDLKVPRSADLLDKEVSVELDEYGKVVGISKLNSV